MRFAISAPPFAEPADLVDLGRMAERKGWDAFFLWDHMVVDRAGVAIVDPWVVLGAIASHTTTIRLGTCVTPLARRRVQKVARETTTLDRLSNGRLTLGVGLGYPAEEMTTFGEDATPRVLARRLDESLTVLNGLWSGATFEFAGEHLRVEPVCFAPTPLQRPRPPIWVACTLPFTGALDRAARCDGIVPIKVGADGLVFLGVDDVAFIADEIGRRRGSLDGYDIVVNAGPPPSPTVEQFAVAGATWWLASMGHFPGWFDELRGIVDAGPPR